MEQIPLDVQLADHAVFDTWLAGDNGALVHALQQLVEERAFSVCWLWGGQESGKSHLLQARVNEAYRHQFRTAYLPVGSGSELEPGMVENMDDLDNSVPGRDRHKVKMQDGTFFFAGCNDIIDYLWQLFLIF
jgi:DnaA family protein